MTKKIILILFLFISFFGGVNDLFADAARFEELDNKYNKEQGITKDEIKEYNKYTEQYGFGGDAVENAKKSEKRKKQCDDNKNCLNEASFTIETSKFSPLKTNIGGNNTTEKVNWLLGTIIQKLMIALGVLSVLIMTIGGGYIIMFHGQDELLSKGKSIFMSGVIALVVALSSYYLVSGLRFILYN